MRLVYGFVTWPPEWPRHRRLRLIRSIGPVRRFGFQLARRFWHCYLWLEW